MDFHSPFSRFSYCDKREKTPNGVISAYNSRGIHRRPANSSDDIDIESATATIHKRDLLGHYGCVNAIEFSSDGRLIASGGDDRRLLIWDLWRTILEDKAPLSINTPHISNVNSCCFDNADKKVITGGNDGQVIVHDIEVLKSTSVYGLSDAVYCISPDPINSTVLATASDEGKVQILDTRTSDDSFPVTLADTGGSMHSVMYNSAEPRILATANSKLGVAIWDIRMPLKYDYKEVWNDMKVCLQDTTFQLPTARKCLNYKSNIHNCMSVRFNTRGDKLFALRRKAPPVLYDIAQTQPIYQFDHDTYYNACTLKGGSFAGSKDEFVVSGSDDFCVYLWRIPDSADAAFTQTEPHAILRGHRSIVNQVRYCPHNQMIITSGVEKLIKVWSPYPTPDHNSKETKYSRICENSGATERNAYSHEEYIHMVLRAGSFLSHDYTNGNTAEEPCMIAFFDSLIQREVEQRLSESDKLSQSSGESSDGDGQGGERLMDQSDNSLMFGMEEDERSGSSSIVEERRSSLGSESQGRSDRLSTSRADRLSYMEYETSSDSGSEVDEILSAMYNRYMHSREQSENQGPTGKKISSVIAQGKYKNKNKEHVCKQRLQHIGENLQHSDDQYLRDNARNLSILADVIDNFVDNLVASDSSTSRSVASNNTSSTSSNGGITTTTITSSVASSSSRTMQTTPSTHSSHSSGHYQGNSSAGILSTQTNTSTSVSAAPSHSQNSNDKPSPLEPGRYFIPELEAFAPQTLQLALNQDQNDRSSVLAARPDSRRTSDPKKSISSTKRKMENGSTSMTDSSSARYQVKENGSSSSHPTSSQSRILGNGSCSATNGSSSSCSSSKSKSKKCTKTNNNSTASKNGACSCSSSEENESSTSDTERSALNLLVQSADVIQFGFNFATRKIPPQKQTKTSGAGVSTKVKSSSKHASCQVISSSSTPSSSSSSTSTSSSSTHTAAQTHLPKTPLLSPTLRLSKSIGELKAQQSFPIKETGAYSSKECSGDTNEPVTFKKISKCKSKKRRFRIQKVGDSSSSSEDDVS